MSKIAEGTKERRTKITELRPPADIRSNTKARRAWLAEQLATVLATPERDGKIVGTGSYQVVSVYEVKQVAGRVRFRGICQCCGGSQVVDLDMPAKSFDTAGAIVMHGYNRPGDGYLIGRCPGVRMAPLNRDKQFTQAWSDGSEVRLAEMTKVLAEVAAEEKAALRDLRDDAEPGAYQNRPQWTIRGSNKEADYNDAEKAVLAQYRQDMKAWAAEFPKHARYERAKIDHSEARNAHWAAKCTAEHFRTLLASGTFGTELEKEVVA